MTVVSYHTLTTHRLFLWFFFSLQTFSVVLTRLEPTVWNRLALNAQRSTCIYLLGAGIKYLGHHASLSNELFISSFLVSSPHLPVLKELWYLKDKEVKDTDSSFIACYSCLLQQSLLVYKLINLWFNCQWKFYYLFLVTLLSPPSLPPFLWEAE